MTRPLTFRQKPSGSCSFEEKGQDIDHVESSESHAASASPLPPQHEMTEKRCVRLSDLTTPAFIINRHSFAKNCRDISKSAKARNLLLRPHIKTHKTMEGAWIQATGLESEDEEPFDGAIVTGFVASTLPEVSQLVNAAQNLGGEPFNDILYGVPIGASKLKYLDKLRCKLMGTKGVIHILVDHLNQVRFVEDFLRHSSNPVPFSVFLKLDTGYHRAGVPCDERGVPLAQEIIQSPFLMFHGVYSHCGHAYDTNEPAKLDDIASTDISLIQSFLEQVKESVASKGIGFKVDNLVVSVGSTPSAFVHKNLPNIPKLEIHPGNYTLYDRQQLWTGACPNEGRIAGRVLARVIGHYEDRNTLMLDAGATALTKETTPQGGYATIAGFDYLICYKMSQEVMLVKHEDETQAFPFDKLPIGTLVNLIPNHSCLAAACFDKYYVIDDPINNFEESPVVEEWVPVKGFSC